MATRRLGRTDLTIEPLIFGCNVLGWTLQEADAHRVLDAYVAAGFTAFDTADVYGKGASETILGNWMKARGNRGKVQIFTKVGAANAEGRRDLSARWIAHEVENSLKRLQTDVIDLYQSHWPDAATPQQETLEAFDRLVKAGKVRWIGSSNQDRQLLSEALNISSDKGLARYQTVQNEFNLYDRAPFEDIQRLCVDEQVSGIGYYSLARGFLAGKYRSAADAGKSLRGKVSVDKYLNPKGERILKTLDAVAKAKATTPAAVAIAWIAAQPGVGAAIASATSVDQLKSLMDGARLKLGPAELDRLTEAGR